MLSEIRQSIRMLLRHAAFSVPAILILGLGCAATTTIFSIAYGVLLRDLPYDQPERLVAIGAKLDKAGFPKTNAGAADYFDWRKRQQVFDDLALTRTVANFNLTGAGEPERLQGARTTASLFPTLRVTPLLGRTFTEQEQIDPARAGSVAVLGYGLWQRRFGGDPTIVGRRIRLNGRDTEVLGVMPENFHYPTREFEIWAPLYYPPDQLRDRLDFSYLCVARLRAGVTIEQARAHLSVIAANLAREYPKTNAAVGAYVEPLLGQITESVRPAILLLLAAVGTLFLVGCVNLANLLLARATGRQREFAIRGALGATRSRLIRQTLLETVPVAAAGAVLGVLSAFWLISALKPLLPPDLPRIEEIGIQAPVLLFTLLLATLACMAVSMIPAFRLRTSLQRGPAGNAGVRDALVVAEIAATVVLLVSAGLLMRGFIRVRSTPPGFRTDHVLSLHLAVDRPLHGPDDPAVAAYLGRLLRSVQSVPGVESAGIVNRLPLGGQTQTLGLEFEGRQSLLNVDSRSVSQDYFRTMGIPLLAGRTFREDDLEGRPGVGILDQRAARELFGTADPIGKRFRIGIVSGMPWIEVVGVVGHIRHEGLDSDPRPQVYWPYGQRTQDRMAMAVRTAGDPASFAGPVRDAIRAVDPDQPLYDVRTMSLVVERTTAGQRLNVVLVGSFAALALLLAGIGLYGVISHLTARRVREFGIRLAVGATPRDLLTLVLGQGVGRAVCGLALGLLLSAVATRWLVALLRGLEPFDPLAYAAASVLLLLVVLAASYFPARRAARTDPIAALRCE